MRKHKKRSERLKAAYLTLTRIVRILILLKLLLLLLVD
jgi:hypothetical protein